MTEALWIVVIVNALGFLGLLVKAYFEFKANKKTDKGFLNTQRMRALNNPHYVPGKSQTCTEHSERLVKMETEISNMKDDIGEIKLDIRELKTRK